MAANDMSKWDNGFPYQGVEPAATNTMSFWDNGFPYQFIEASSGAGSAGFISYAFIL